MILTDREIQIAIQNKLLTINPAPIPEAYSSTSVDLTLAAEGKIWKHKPGQPLQPSNKDYSYMSTLDRQEAVAIRSYAFEPQKFLLAWTRETVDLPITSRLAARVEGKSSIARLGVGIHVTAPTIHAGFRGQIQLEMFNFGPNTILLDEGMKICQLIFEQTIGTPEKGYVGRFIGQTASTL